MRLVVTLPAADSSGVTISDANLGGAGQHVAFRLHSAVADDALELGIVSNTYQPTGTLEWIANNNFFLYYPAEFRIGTGIGSTSVATFATDGTVQFGFATSSLVTLTAKPASTAGIQLDPNAATGNFTLSLSPANLTANRRVTFPDLDLGFSSNPGAAAAVLMSSASGFLTLVGLGLGTGVAVEAGHIQAIGNKVGELYWTLQNASANATAQTRIRAVNDTSNYIDIAIISSGASPANAAALTASDLLIFGAGGVQHATLSTGGIFSVKTSTTAGIALDPNAATGDFTVSLSPANLTGNRRATFPNLDGTVAYGTGAATRVAYWSGTNTLTSDAGMTYTEASDLLTVGALTVGASGNLTLNTGADTASFLITGNAASNRSINFQTGGVNRWLFRTNSDAESGSNAGSNLVINARSDAGADLGNALQIIRSTQNVGLGVSPSARLHVNVTDTATSVTAYFDSNHATGAQFSVRHLGTGAVGNVVDYVAWLKDSLGTLEPMGLIRTTALVVTSGSEDSRMEFQTMKASARAGRLFIDKDNIGINTTTFGTSAAGVLGIANAIVVPGSSPANMIQIYSRDSSLGSANATLAIRTEQAVEAIGTFTPSHKVRMFFNEVEYHVQLDAV